MKLGARVLRVRLVSREEVWASAGVKDLGTTRVPAEPLAHLNAENPENPGIFCGNPENPEIKNIIFQATAQPEAQWRPSVVK